MTRHVRLLIAAGCCSMYVGAVSAQTPTSLPERTPERYVDPANGLSLSDAVLAAQEREPLLRAARSAVDTARAMRVQAGLRANPTASIEHRQEPAAGDTQTMVTLEWPLELHRRAARVATAEREIEVSQYAAAQRERTIVADVRLRYGAAAAAVRELEIADQIVAASRRQLELLRGRVLEGASPPIDRDVFEVEVRRAEADRSLAVARADAAVHELRRAVGQRPDTPLMLRDTLESLVTTAPPIEESVSREAAVTGRPDLQEAEARVRLATAEVDRASSEGRADMTLYASYMRMDSAFPQRAFDAAGVLVPIHGIFNYATAGARITLPVRNQNQGAIAAARTAKAGAEAALEAARLSAQTEIAAATARDAQTRTALAQLQEATAMARRNLDVVRQAYELGRMTVSDVLTEQRRYLETEHAYTGTLRDVYDAHSAALIALGEER